MLIKLVMKIYSLNLVSVYRGYTLIVFMTQGYFTAKRLRTTVLKDKIFQKLNLKTCYTEVSSQQALCHLYASIVYILFDLLAQCHYHQTIFAVSFAVAVFQGNCCRIATKYT